MTVQEFREWISGWPAEAEIKVSESLFDPDPKQLTGFCTWPSGTYQKNDIKEVTILVH